MATSTELVAARDAALKAMRGAKYIAQFYSETISWARFTPGSKESEISRARDFGHFIQTVNAASIAIREVDSLLPPAQPVARFGGIVSGTAHGVAVKFGNTVIGAMTRVFTDCGGDDDVAGQLFNRAMSGDVDSDYLEECKSAMCEALKQVEIIDTEELYFAIVNEAKLAIASLPPSGRDNGADFRAETKRFSEIISDCDATTKLLLNAQFIGLKSGRPIKQISAEFLRENGDIIDSNEQTRRDTFETMKRTARNYMTKFTDQP